ncbi:hypothetical protein [Caldicellulosiruptor morganii]|uniref:Uncharacterized protein n=1 Tax=Caldicellulosiruptor morganii TaxID=1387555 RepID=A0ABY7BNH8_9FIRM|nr:hypothetical protein [Caldicellulosiruptor morganii]WAM33877.1 hypothetical protein OTK00_000017 [Caldicellulosiruptor morganii]
MGHVITSIQEIYEAVIKNITIPDAVKSTKIEGSRVILKVKPVSLFPEIELKFEIKSEGSRIIGYFDKQKRVLIYGFLSGAIKRYNFEGIEVFKDRVEADLQKVIFNNVKGIKVESIMVDAEGNVRVDFCVR